MQARIYNQEKLKFETIEIPNSVSIVERLDRSYDASSFNFYSDKDTCYPPFSIIEIDNTCYFFSTTCNKYVTLNNVYLHNATLIEPTKILETLLIGAKGFRVRKDVETEDGYHRILTLINIIRDKYCTSNNVSVCIKNTRISIQVSPRLRYFLIAKRDYNFGSGTTLFDAVNEITSTHGYLLKCQMEYEEYGNIFLLVIDAVDLLHKQASNVPLNIKDINCQTRSSTQDVNDYCYTIESEFNDVVDLTKKQTWVGTARSDAILSEDNAELILPYRIYDVVGMRVKLSELTRCDVLSVPRNYSFMPLNWDIDTKGLPFWSGSNTKLGYFNAFTLLGTENWLAQSIFNDEVIAKVVESKFLNQFRNALNIAKGKNDDYANYIRVVVFVTENYVNYCFFPWCESYQPKQEGFLYLENVLENKLYQTLTASDRRFFASFTHNDARITELNNDYTDFGSWGSDNIISAIRLLAKNNDVQKGDYLFNDIHQMSHNGDFWYIEDYNIVTRSNDYTNCKLSDLIYKVDYIATNSLSNIVSKSVTAQNEGQFKNLSKSYSNGSNNVDLNAIHNDMQREADSLGNVQYAFESFENIELGRSILFSDDKKKYGYITLKEKVITPTRTKYNYNTVANLYSIAQQIGVATQYESTKVVFENVVDRHIFKEIRPLNTGFAHINDVNCMLFLTFCNTTNTKLNNVTYTDVSIPMSLYEDTNHYYAVATTYSNYIFGFRCGVGSENSGLNGSYKQMIPITIGTDGEATSFDIAIHSVIINTLTKERLNILPLSRFSYSATTDAYTLYQGNINVYKDSSERLTFTFKIEKLK